MKLKVKLLLVALLCANFGYAQQKANTYAIIPKPQSLVARPGSFTWSRSTKIMAATKDVALQNALLELNNISLKLKANGANNIILVVKDPSIKSKEAYQLVVQPHQIQLKVADRLGAAWAIASLKQLMGEQILGNAPLQVIKVPCVEVVDQPRFAWRGMHLDVSRHFFEIDYLYKMIDRMSYYKLNKLHLHLSDDQGWRIEIKKYPELTEKGAWRTLNDQDSVCLELARTNPDFELPKKHFRTIGNQTMYGGYYSQGQMRSVIAYASLKGIEIIPEIDMPGHMMAANQLMPWLTSRGQTGLVKTFTEPICPCKESTFEFAENVFTEIAALFPSQYIHLGADEVEKSSWKDLPECEELMKREGLKNVDELQSYFVRRMEKFFNSKGKKLIGWDEILDGGVSTTATVMYWRSWVKDAPKQAAAQGNRLIMTPSSYCYFDYKQDNETIKNLYGFDPLAFGMDAKAQQNVLGVQGNTWTEYIPSERRLEYMVFPRMLALAEVGWGKADKGWPDFEPRLQRHTALLDAMNINYRMPDLSGFIEKSVFVDSAQLYIKKPFHDMVVRYTTDGTAPHVNSAVLPDVLWVKNSTLFKVAGFSPSGHRGDVYTINYEKQHYLKAVEPTGLQNGLQFYYYPVYYKNTTLINEKDLAEQKITKAIEIPLNNTAPSFGTRHVGYFYAPTDGVYSFALRSDDGSVLKIGGKTLIDNDGMHSSEEKSAQVALAKGYHPFELLFIEGGGGYTLQLQYRNPNGALVDIDPVQLFH